MQPILIGGHVIVFILFWFSWEFIEKNHVLCNSPKRIKQKLPNVTAKRRHSLTTHVYCQIYVLGTNNRKIRIFDSFLFENRISFSINDWYTIKNALNNVNNTCYKVLMNNNDYKHILCWPNMHIFDVGSNLKNGGHLGGHLGFVTCCESRFF